MKSILTDSKHTSSVYPPERTDALGREAGLIRTPVSKADILTGGYRDVQYIFSTWGMPSFTREEIREYLPSLKAVFYSAGSVQGFAREFLEEGVRVFSAWGANAIPVAEYTAAQIVLANKGFFGACRRTKDKDSRKAARAYSVAHTGNYNTRVGIVGAGMIGRLVIEKLKTLDVEILVYDPYLKDDLGVKKVSLETLFSECAVISNHVANLPETVGMFDYSLFQLMDKCATFINTGRGAQVVEADLIRILTENPDMTAVLDVTYPEPPEESSPLYSMDNVFLTPHIAGSQSNEVERMSLYMYDEFMRVKSGEAPLYEVSMDMLERMA